MSRYRATYVHKISPRPEDSIEVDLRLPNGTLTRTVLGKALRDCKVLGKGDRLTEFRVETVLDGTYPQVSRIVAFPAASIWWSIILTPIAPARNHDGWTPGESLKVSLSVCVMNTLQAQMYGHAPSPCPTCSDVCLTAHSRENAQATLDHYKVGDRVRTTKAMRLANYEEGDFYGHPGTVLECLASARTCLHVRWDAFEHNGHTIPAREGLAHPGNVQHCEAKAKGER